MEARIDIITLAVADLERALGFYRDGLGLESRGVIGTEFVGDEVEPDGAIAMFELQGGMILCLYPRTELAKDAKVPLGPPKTGEFSIGQAVASKAEVDALLTQAQAAGPPLPTDLTTVHGESTPATFATPTDTYGRSSTTHDSSARRSDLSRLDRTVPSSALESPALGLPHLDEEGGGQQNAWTTRNTVFMTWNMLHMARMLKDNDGFPAYGNSTHDWNLEQPEHPNPEYR